MNHPDTDIADAIIAGMGSADNPTEQMAEIVAHLERAGFVIKSRAQHEALMAAAKAAEIYYRGYAQDAARELRDALAACRAAGIDLKEKT